MKVWDSEKIVAYRDSNGVMQSEIVYWNEAKSGYRTRSGEFIGNACILDGELEAVFTASEDEVELLLSHLMRGEEDGT